MKTSRSVLLRLRNFLEKKVLEEIGTHFMDNNSFPESRGLYETMWMDVVQPDGPHMTV